MPYCYPVSAAAAALARGCARTAPARRRGRARHPGRPGDHRPPLQRGRLRLLQAGRGPVAGPGPHRHPDRAGARANSPTRCCSTTATPSRAPRWPTTRRSSKPVRCGETLAIYKVMNQLGYDGGGIGNHEFNYGLAYLGQVTGQPLRRATASTRRKPLRRARLPAGAGQRLQRQDAPAAVRALPHPRQARAAPSTPTASPSQATVKVGIIGFTPPTIIAWDKRWLDGQASTRRACARRRERYMPGDARARAPT